MIGAAAFAAAPSSLAKRFSGCVALQMCIRDRVYRVQESIVHLVRMFHQTQRYERFVMEWER